MIFVPPGGAAAFNQQTPAAKASMGMLRTAASAVKRTRRKSKSRATAKRASGAKRGKRKLKFGSPAWQKKYGRKRKRK